MKMYRENWEKCLWVPAVWGSRMGDRERESRMTALYKEASELAAGT